MTAEVSGRLSGRVAIVTGAASGIGRAVAQTALREGARLALLDVDHESITAMAEEMGDAAWAYEVDVADPVSVDAAISAAVARHGKIDILFNVAGIQDHMVPAEELNLRIWDRVFAVNVRGTVIMIERVLREMLAAGSGAIVNTSSVAGMLAGAGGVAYTASKGAVDSLTRQVAYEVADRGIRVNSVAPGATMTNFIASTAKALGIHQKSVGPKAVRFADHALEVALRSGSIPINRFADPLEIAKAIVFLGSDDASYIVGSTLVIDGGWSII